MAVKNAYEARKVITLWGKRGWRFVDEGEGYAEDSLLRGSRSMNVEINKVAQHVTLQSVSYSHVVLPSSGPQATLGTVLVSATLVYSGQLDILKVFGSSDESGKRLKGDETVIQVWL